MRENVFFFCFVSIFSPPEICEKISFFRKKNPHFRECGGIQKKSQKKSKAILGFSSGRQMSDPNRPGDPIKNDPVK